ncbi:M20/M25/M40 family metallo-hydrolase [Flavobacterium branchiarum]|uniref:Vacuolar membrane protease n=1 Tax=Flavobacterium branchiarum TaxID=1114870 RepID=A0ABV5FQJ8_9FLAO|nr:M20/M25/M40 family metallo-hydrolase [Flavobacterium branchiarum]MDN3675503.1 M20/M25/M40 family metallo-hydrolase [Flavobacterium branchiarum]
MKKNIHSVLSILVIIAVLAFIYITLKPQWVSKGEEALAEFSTDRALSHVKEIAQKPHYVGSANHEVVAQYLESELKELGLETSVQEGFTMSDWGNLVKSKNIMARIKGSNNTKALLLLSHYDSAPHSSSHGASDDASGVATILEGVRAFLYSKEKHKNDIIILFTDAEELGLNGAALFVTEHQWAKDVGLVINFEARGTSGPSYMLMETNSGNAELVKEFANAKTTYPVSNSLMYSIYKMLPNDTDLTVFREQGDIQGFNFAFIDDHFNYHTQQDDLAHLNKTSLTHQGSYLMPLMKYFSNTNLKEAPTKEDFVYFTVPFTFINYPFAWVLPMTLIALGLFIVLIFIGKAKRIITFSEIFRGFVPLLGAIVIGGLVTFLGWKIILQVYPQYNDLLNGFTYNGHVYIAAFVLLTIAICFAFYNSFSDAKLTMNHFVAPLFLWIIINAIVAYSLRGAGFLIIPVYFGLFLFAIYVVTQKANLIISLLFGIPTLLIIAPFIHMFPIGLGLKVLFGSAILTVLAFGLLLPVFGSFLKKGIWALIFFVASITCFAWGGYTSGYENGKAKSNSLLYVYNADNNTYKWATYDVNLDEWTKKYLGQEPKDAIALNDLPLFSKYSSGFSYSADAPKITLAKPTIAFLQDSIRGNTRFLKIKITPNRNVNRYDIFGDTKMDFNNFKANGVAPLGQKGSQLKRKGAKILSYYVINNEPLIMQFSIDAKTVFDMSLIESSFDLLSNTALNVQKRASWMMPTPFVLNDAVVIREKIKPTKVVLDSTPTASVAQDSLNVANDSLKPSTIVVP